MSKGQTLQEPFLNALHPSDRASTWDNPIKNPRVTPMDLEASGDELAVNLSLAVTGFQVCLRGATEQSWFNEWSRLCEVELNQMQPSEYPLAAEAKPEAGYMVTTMTPAAVVDELPEDKKIMAVSAPE